MTLKQFQRIQKQLQAAENMALENGVNISSPEFENAYKLLKLKFLDNAGIAIDEYDAFKEELKQRRIEARKKRIEVLGGKEVEDIQINFGQHIEKVKEEGLNNLQKLAEERKLKEGELQQKIRESLEYSGKLEKEINDLKDLSNKRVLELDEQNKLLERELFREKEDSMLETQQLREELEKTKKEKEEFEEDILTFLEKYYE